MCTYYCGPIAVVTIISILVLLIVCHVLPVCIIAVVYMMVTLQMLSLILRFDIIMLLQVASKHIVLYLLTLAT